MTQDRQGLVAIHQPNFFPWLGYFDKLARCDHFVVLDDVQIQKKGGSWVNRVKLLVAGEPRWVTAAIDRSYHGVKPICEVRLDRGNAWQEKFVGSLQASYAQAPAFDEAMDLVLPLIRSDAELVADYNLHAISAISEAVGLSADKMVRASSFRASGAGNEFLIALVQAAGGHIYLAGGGASGYQDDRLFEEAGIEVEYQDFQHPTYPQAGSPDAFVPGLSIIDALMNVGVAGTRDLLAR